MVWLLGLSTRDQVHNLIQRMLSDDTAHLREVVSFVMGLYPGAEDKFSPPSDVVATWIALPELLAQGDVVAGVVAEQDPVPQANAVARLISAISDFPQAAGLATLILERAGTPVEPSVLVRLAQFSVPDRRLDELLVDLLDTHPPSSMDQIATLVDELTRLGLVRAAATAQGVLVELHRELARDQPDRYTPELALSLNNHAIIASVTWGAPGRPSPRPRRPSPCTGSWLATIPTATPPTWPWSLHTYARRLGDLGRAGPALAAAEEALALCRELARDQPDRYTPDLAIVPQYLRGHAPRPGAPGPALAAAEEALALCRELARDHPDRYIRDLAMSLSTYAITLGDLGRPGSRSPRPRRPSPCTGSGLATSPTATPPTWPCPSSPTRPRSATWAAPGPRSSRPRRPLPCTGRWPAAGPTATSPSWPCPSTPTRPPSPT